VRSRSVPQAERQHTSSVSEHQPVTLSVHLFAMVKSGGSSKTSSPKLTLERIIGLTASTHSALSIHPLSDHVAYPAGCVVVIYSIRKNRQVDFLSSGNGKAIHCVSYSPTGRLLAAGESGHLPSVAVWDLNTKSVVAQLPGHKYGVSCVCFSPNSELLASVGFQPDSQLLLWDWQNELTLASNTSVADKVLSLSFSSDGRKLVTAGTRHATTWSVDQYHAGQLVMEVSALEGNAAVLGSHKESIFYDVHCTQGVSSGQVFGITSRGVVCQLGGDQVMAVERFVDLKVKRTYSVFVGTKYVVCGCSDGVIRMFEPVSMKYVCTLPRPHALGRENRPDDSPAAQLSYADVIAAKLTADETRLVALYSDRSLYVWNVESVKNITKARSFLAHSSCIWDIALMPAHDKEGGYPPGTFVTCAADNTIRLWNLDVDRQSKQRVVVSNGLRSVYSKEMLACKAIEASSEEDGVSAAGLRCLAISPDGSQLVCGDHTGTLNVLDLADLKLLHTVQAHDGEVMRLCFTATHAVDKKECLLASAGRDRVIHLLRPKDCYKLVNSVSDHSGAVTSVHFGLSDTKLLR